MSSESLYGLAADGILVTHVLIAAFVVIGFVAIWLGKWLSWDWVRNFRFRVLHLAAITIVVLQSWLGAICPLTIWEMRLRVLAGRSMYEGSFIQHWLQSILYYEAPAWVFVVMYTVFGGLVVAAWFVVPPQRRK